MIEDLFKNEVFAGVFGGMVVGSLFFLAREVPATIWWFLRRRFTASVTIFNDDPAFDLLSEWLNELRYTKSARHTRLTTVGSCDGDARPRLTPGGGSHLFRHKGTWIHLARSVSEPNEASLVGRPEELTLTTFGPDPSKLYDILGECVLDSDKPKNHVEVFAHHYWWRKVAKKRPRPVEQVVLPPGQTKRIVDDIARFLGRADWYRERGVPYRRGYLLEGPPGTGKTSFVLAIAGHFGRPVYALSLGGLESDNDLMSAIVRVPSRAILLLEDIDAATRAAKQRAEGATEDKERKGITLSGLLNALDGTFSHDGRILVMTTNHPEQLDEALVRPGRVDVREHFGKHGPDEVLAHARQFLPSDQAVEFARTVECPIAPADLQERLLKAS